MRMLYKTLTVAAILAALLATGCVPLQRITAPAASSSASPAALQYDADPLAWLTQKTGGTSQESLSVQEKESLTALAELTAYIAPCARTEDLNQWDTIFPLYIYYQSAFYYNEATDSYLIHTNMPYAPDRIEDREFESYMITPAKNAQEFVRGVLGKEIPEMDQDFGDWDNENYIVSRNGMYYVREGDYDAPALRLRAYQPLGDGIFYLSFDGDDSGMPGPEESMKGNTPDYCRLLVVRSDSAWGFTVKAKLKEGADSLLPADFPLPLYAA